MISAAVCKDNKASLLVHLRDETLNFSGKRCTMQTRNTTRLLIVCNRGQRPFISPVARLSWALGSHRQIDPRSLILAFGSVVPIVCISVIVAVVAVNIFTVDGIHQANDLIIDRHLIVT